MRTISAVFLSLLYTSVVGDIPNIRQEFGNRIGTVHAIFSLAALHEELDPFQIVVGITIKAAGGGLLIEAYLRGCPLKVAGDGSFHFRIHNRNRWANPRTFRYDVRVI